MKLNYKSITILGLLALASQSIVAQTERFEPIPYGNMDSWLVREIEESFIIGGGTKYVYEVAPGDTLFDNVPYKNTISPWACSSVLARVKGITKASISVFPEKRDNGYCARLETLMEGVKVFGLININVLASGTIFLGEMVEPITDTNNPQSKLNTGIPFSKKPKAMQYDYKVITGGKSIKATGFGRQQKLDQRDMAEIHLLLQYRWEDANGNIYAKRVATGWERFKESQKEWQNGHRMLLHYGDISQTDFYKPYMKLRSSQEEAYYAQNSKGKMVPIIEQGWATENENPTHLVLQFSSSNGGAYIGNIDSRLWVDNVGFVYDK